MSQQTFMFDDTVRGNVTLGTERTDDEVWARPAGRPGRRVRRAAARGPRHPGRRARHQPLRRPAPAGRPGPRGDPPAAAARPRRRHLGGRPGRRAGRSSPRSAQASSGTTVLVVAYRMATITLADDIVYLEEGRVVDHGTHDELLGRCDGYQRLVTAYAREAAERAAVAADEERADGIPVRSTGGAGDRGGRPMSMRSARRSTTPASSRARAAPPGRPSSAASSCRRRSAAASGSPSRWRSCRRWASCSSPSSSSAPPTRASSPQGGPDAGIVLRYVLLAMVGVAVTALCSYFVNVRLFTASENGLSSLRHQGVPAHPRPVGAHPEHRAPRLAGLAGHLGRRHHLDVRPVRRPHVHGQHRAAVARDGAHGHLQPAARGRRVGLLRPAVLHHPSVPGHRRPGLHRGSRAGRRHARRRSPRRSSGRRPSAHTASRTARPSGSTRPSRPTGAPRSGRRPARSMAFTTGPAGVRAHDRRGHRRRHPARA